MDFLDFIDSETKEKKSHRVRSWYLYEQYKSLERNQLDAAQQLKNKSCQDKILRQELHERRARRKLCDQFGLASSECHVPQPKSETTKTSLSVSSNDFFESFCELQDEISNRDSERGSFSEETFIQDDSHFGKSYLEEFKSLENLQDSQSCAESVNSVVENYKSNEDLAADITEKLKIFQNNIAEEANQHQLETVKENVECLEDYNKTDENMSGIKIADSLEELDLKNMSVGPNTPETDINLFHMWSKLVSFAYQVIQLNHGNCYYDYGSQFLTAVLACDVLRRGVSSMCHILQPYVSPIKYVTDDSDNSVASHMSTKGKMLPSSKKSRNKIKAKQKLRYKTRQTTHHSDDFLRKQSKCIFEFKNNKRHRASEPCHSRAKFSSYCYEPSEKSSDSTIWPTFSKEYSLTEYRCPYHEKVTNPMLKIGKYIDRLLEDIDGCQK